MRKYKKLVYGVGINDANYKVSKKCPFYDRWVHMLERCYSRKFLNRRKTYEGCTVHNDWLHFMNFRAWMMFQDWEGKQLDKDIIVPNNKIYGPDTCCFVDNKLNSLLTNRAAGRGDHPLGVTFCKNTRKFNAKCKLNGKNKNLGYFNSPNDAFEVYINFKSKIIIEIAMSQVDNRIRDGLLSHAQILKRSGNFSVYDAW